MAEEGRQAKVTPGTIALELAPLLSGWGPVTSRKMFGGTAFFVDKRIFCFIWKQGLVVKLGEGRIDALVESVPGSERFSPRPATGPSRNWAQIPFKYLPSDGGVGWIREAFDYAVSGKEETSRGERAVVGTKKPRRTKKAS